MLDLKNMEASKGRKSSDLCRPNGPMNCSLFQFHPSYYIKINIYFSTYKNVIYAILILLILFFLVVICMSKFPHQTS